MPQFELHPRLTADSHAVGDAGLSRVLLASDARFPWFILVPRRADIREAVDLDAADQQTLLEESNRLARYLLDHYGADKLNIAALGNVVPQLHIHHVARYTTDAVWPQPIWGTGPAQAYEAMELRARLTHAREALELD